MIDASESRVPVVIGLSSCARAGDAVLTDHDFVPPPGVVRIAVSTPSGLTGHHAACQCCGRSAWARALTAAYVHRARSGRPQFARVVVDVDEGSRAAVLDAIVTDAFVSGRYVAD